MNEPIKLGLTLMIVTIIAGAALALTNHYTAPKIKEQIEIAIKESLNKVITADSFEDKEDYYDAYKDEKLTGRVLKISASGYSSTIQALVGINLENKITGIDIISQQETPGLGANIAKQEFLQQFIGKEKEQLKIKKDNGEIDAVTGATTSSRAITEEIRKMMEACPCDINTGDSTQTTVAKVYVNNKNLTNETE